jgi:hypothetical protein
MAWETLPGDVATMERQPSFDSYLQMLNSFDSHPDTAQLLDDVPCLVPATVHFEHTTMWELLGVATANALDSSTAETNTITQYIPANSAPIGSRQDLPHSAATPGVEPLPSATARMDHQEKQRIYRNRSRSKKKNEASRYAPAFCREAVLGRSSCPPAPALLIASSCDALLDGHDVRSMI